MLSLTMDGGNGENIPIYETDAWKQHDACHTEKEDNRSALYS